jgi:hypothetical protein
MTNTEDTIRVHADHSSAKHLGTWTTARSFDVRVRRGAAVLDLRSPAIEGDLTLHLDVDHGLVKLLLPADMTVDHRDLRWTGRGKVKDWEASRVTGDRRLHVTGRIDSGEIRVHRGGVAILSAMFSKAYVEDVKRAHREGGTPTVDDPSRIPA